MVWGIMSSQGLGRLVKIDERMDSQAYLEMIENNLTFENLEN